jgi:hypothetical protein
MATTRTSQRWPMPSKPPAFCWGGKSEGTSLSRTRVTFSSLLKIAQLKLETFTITTAPLQSPPSGWGLGMQEYDVTFMSFAIRVWQLGCRGARDESQLAQFAHATMIPWEDEAVIRRCALIGRDGAVTERGEAAKGASRDSLSLSR